MNELFTYGSKNSHLILNDMFRFLAIILGPQGTGAQMIEYGRALGTLFTDQVRYGYLVLSLLVRYGSCIWYFFTDQVRQVNWVLLSWYYLVLLSFLMYGRGSWYYTP